ncbi:MAG TPA: hypothetical protein VFW87_23550 [Pirellulales bacterium]|nr:hypothetical protein [Pirellulales bacterium]
MRRASRRLICLIAVCHISARVIVSSNDGDTSMAAIGRLNEQMQIPEVVVVYGH